MQACEFIPLCIRQSVLCNQIVCIFMFVLQIWYLVEQIECMRPFNVNNSALCKTNWSEKTLNTRQKMLFAALANNHWTQLVSFLTKYCWTLKTLRYIQERNFLYGSTRMKITQHPACLWNTWILDRQWKWVIVMIRFGQLG